MSWRASQRGICHLALARLQNQQDYPKVRCGPAAGGVLSAFTTASRMGNNSSLIVFHIDRVIDAMIPMTLDIAHPVKTLPVRSRAYRFGFIPESDYRFG